MTHEGKGLLSMERTYLSHVPIAVFLRYPLGHVGSAAYPHCPMVGVNPSCAWRGRKAEAERQDAQQAPSPSGAADHLLPLLTRLFSSSSSSADSQTTKLLCSPSRTFIETQLSGQRRRRGRKGEICTLSQSLCAPHGRVASLAPCAPSLIPPSPFFSLHGGGGGSLSKWTCPRAVRPCARVCGRACARGAPRGRSAFSADNSDVAPLRSSGFHVAKWLQRLPTNNSPTLGGVEASQAAGFPCRAPLGLRDTLSAGTARLALAVGVGVGGHQITSISIHPPVRLSVHPPTRPSICPS